MGWSVTYCGTPPVVELAYQGAVDARELQEAFVATQQALARHSSLLLLANCLGMTTGPSVTEVFELAETLIRNGVPPGFKEAIILPLSGEARANAVFFETACLNRGLNIKILPTREEGLRWLANP